MDCKANNLKRAELAGIRPRGESESPFTVERATQRVKGSGRGLVHVCRLQSARYVSNTARGTKLKAKTSRKHGKNTSRQRDRRHRLG
ncbi:hypothetical protein QQF64_028065 [Cirrhinus molitorella]|uniref:Uncharacterized protein n=1 Tax=Cirrhinus molitorella TaxID=172907 RepID=A0ABR3N5N5_9TELE